MTRLKPGDKVRVIAPHSNHHHAEGIVTRIQGNPNRKPTLVIKTDRGYVLWAQPEALIMVVS